MRLNTLLRECLQTLGNLLYDKLCRQPMPLTPVAEQVMSGVGDADPFGVDAATLGPQGLLPRRARIGPRIAGAVDDQEPAPDGHQIGVVSRPPWSECHDAADVGSGAQVRGDPSAHRMADENDPARVDVGEHSVELRLGIVYGISPSAIPSPQAVLHTMQPHTSAEPAPKCQRQPIHPQVGELPCAGGFVALRLATGKDQHAAARSAARDRLRTWVSAISSIRTGPIHSPLGGVAVHTDARVAWL